MKPSSKPVNAARRAFFSFAIMVPMLLGVLLLMSLATQFIPRLVHAGLFGHNPMLDALVGGGLGSISTGQPVVSYVLGGELLASGISMVAITALIVAWVTVGVIQLPMEANMLGMRFAFSRALLSFLFSILIAVLTVWVLHVAGA